MIGWLIRRLRSLRTGDLHSGAGTAGGQSKGEDPRLARALERAEREIIRLPYEVAYAFTPDGQELFRTAGGPERVGFTAEQQQRLAGAILIHNHPRGGSFSTSGDPQVSRSRGDVESAAINQVARTVVVGVDPRGQGWRYTMEPPPEGWSGEVWEERIRPAMERAVRAEFDALLSQARSSDRMPPPDSGWPHRVWTRVAQETGVEYKREGR